MIRATFVVLTLTLAPAACMPMPSAERPVYRTEYLYEGPMSDDGRRCVRGCEKTKTYCKGRADQGTQDSHRRCEEQAIDEYENCQMRTTSLSEKRQCYRKSCPVGPDYVNCESSYRACFEGCGGHVWSRQVCEGDNC